MGLRNNNRGDTIIEVLLAIAVVSSVLGLTYSTMNRNLLTMRGNQERTEATRAAQDQLERLRSAWISNQAAVTGQSTNGFCINNANQVRPLSGGSPTADPAVDSLADYATAGCASGTGSLYSMGIRRDAVNTKTYRVFVRWPSLNGGISEVSTVYKLP